MKVTRQPHKPRPPMVTLADRVVAHGQRLRQGESANWCTFLVAFSATRQVTHTQKGQR